MFGSAGAAGTGEGAGTGGEAGVTAAGGGTGSTGTLHTGSVQKKKTGFQLTTSKPVLYMVELKC